MAERAQVTSVDALESFRASLLTYLAAARPTLDEMSAEVARTRTWLEEDRMRHWEREVLRRGRLLHDAEAALFSAKMSHLREVSHAEVAAVRHAKLDLEAAQDRLRRVKKWCREFDSRIAPLGHQLDSLRNLFTVALPRAAVELGQTIELLADYAGHSPAASAPPAAAPNLPSPGGAA